MSACASSTSAKQTSTKKRRQRRTFSGCSTCRTRKVKCDEGGWPCQRCKKAELVCQGYPGYRSDVLWKPIKSQSSFRSKSDDLITDHQAQLSNPSSQTTLQNRNGFAFDCGGPIEGSVSRHLDLLPDLPTQMKLIDHWRGHLSDALMPVPGSQNPLKTIFMPIAYEGARSSNTDSSGSVALFYLICASSAFNLSLNVTDEQESEKYSTLALSHHSKGLRHLHHALSDPGIDTEPVLASLLLCVIYEPITVEPQCWRIHVQGALQWLDKMGVDKITRKNMSSKSLYQMLIFYAMLLRSQFDRNAVLHECVVRSTVPTALEPFMLYGLECLPKRTFNTICQVIDASLQPPSELDERWLNVLELEAKLNMPHGSTSEYIAADNRITHIRLLCHNSYAYYFSTQIFLLRTLRAVDAFTEQVQELVAQCLVQLETMQECTSLPFCPVVWPVMIACFEATEARLQDRALSCVDFFAQRSTLMIWKRARILLQQFWAERETCGDRNLQWQSFLNRPGVPDMMMV